MTNYVSLTIASVFPIAVGILLFKYRRKFGEFAHQLSVFRKTIYPETFVMYAGAGGVGFILFGVLMLGMGVTNLVLR